MHTKHTCSWVSLWSSHTCICHTWSVSTTAAILSNLLSLVLVVLQESSIVYLSYSSFFFMFLLQCTRYLCNPYVSSIQSSVRAVNICFHVRGAFLKVFANFSWWLTSHNTFCFLATLNLTSCTSDLLGLFFLFFASLFSILWPLQKSFT